MKIGLSSAAALLLVLASACGDFDPTAPIPERPTIPEPPVAPAAPPLQLEQPADAVLYVVAVDGSGKLSLGRGSAPAWSPDGASIAFASHRSGRPQIHLVNADGSGERQLTRDTFGIVISPTWSPQGDRIAFVTSRLVFGGRVEVINVDGSGRTVIAGDSLQPYGVAWSPDGRQIAFTFDQRSGARYVPGIAVVDPDGTGTRRLIPAEWSNRPCHVPGYCTVAWAPDGVRLAFSMTVNKVNPSINLVHADGSGLRQLSPGISWPETSPSWSPDGSRIAFGGNTDGWGGQTLHVMQSDGTGITEYAGVWGSGEPQWLPGAERVLFDLYGGVGIVPLSGAAPQILVPGAWYARLSPDRQRIVVEGN
jgi:Tol biopolymer transport system component